MLAAKAWRTSPLAVYESVSVQSMLFRAVWRMEDLKTIFDTTATHSSQIDAAKHCSFHTWGVGPTARLIAKGQREGRKWLKSQQRNFLSKPLSYTTLVLVWFFDSPSAEFMPLAVSASDSRAPWLLHTWTLRLMSWYSVSLSSRQHSQQHWLTDLSAGVIILCPSVQRFSL